MAIKNTQKIQYVAKLSVEFAVMLLYPKGSQEKKSTARVKY